MFLDSDVLNDCGAAELWETPTKAPMPKVLTDLFPHWGIDSICLEFVFFGVVLMALFTA